MKFSLKLTVACVALAALLLPARPAGAYSVMTHEQLIDLTWDKSIVPLLLSRYPALTPAQIEHARAFAYGGCVIQDIGYYPFGDPFFSELTHYVRAGDFVVNLFRNAGNADELAFAVGALSHYIGDTVGHSTATNLAVPIEFPKLKARYGDNVNYAQGVRQHVQTEFAFDINEIAHRRFAPVHYLRHVGLQVPTKQLSLAFYQTYGLRADFSSKRGKRINVGGYRFAVRAFIPRIAYAITLLHGKHEPAELMDDDLRKLDADIAAIAAKNDWDAYRKKPGMGTYSLAGLLYVLPKWGALKLVAVKGPTQDTEAAYLRSVIRSTDLLSRALRRFTPPPATVADKHSGPPPGRPVLARVGAFQGLADGPQHPLANRDLDTGNLVKPGGYRLTDDTYANLLHQEAEHPELPIPPGIKADILAYYVDLSMPYATKKNAKQWAQVQKDLATLQTIHTSNELTPYATYGDEDDD